MGGYDSHATQRWAAEPPKGARAAGRGPFERDRARVLHSAALRRLAAKTQVVEVGSGDFPRTRLTHSLECAQVGRELGAAIGCDPDLVDAACLAHDLGHPPFGHNGESALAELAAGCGGFEGNAQSLRLLTRLEAKVIGAGLNLTRATLDATLKYPWLPRPGEVKYGAYADDAEAFGWIRDGAPEGRPCLEAQVMDWADDVAYSVHDLEDGLQAGMISLGQLRDGAERRLVAELTAVAYCEPGSVSADELAEVFAALLKLPCWPDAFDGGLAALAGLKNLTSELIGRFCEAAQDATLTCREPPAGQSAPAGRTGEPGGAAGGATRYALDLVVPRQQRLECALLKGVTAHYVMSRPGVAAAQARQRELIAELAAAVLAGAPGTLEPAFRPAYRAAESDPARLRAVVDQLASLTDTSAIAWHQRLCR
ncbi:MAG: deoxyguanosinetriphosphate triphosphohydrolase [Streptosporangiaceae bacterium]|jgi:dGTPase